MWKTKIRNKIRSFTSLLPAAVLTFCVCSCSKEEGPGMPSDEDGGISVSILLAGQQTDYYTKAEPGQDSEDTDGEYGSVAENYINVDDLYVLTFSIPQGKDVLSDDSELLEILWKPGDYSAESEAAASSQIFSNGEHVSLRAKLNPAIAAYSEDFCIVALANLNAFEISGSGTLNIAEGISFSDLQENTCYDFAEANDSWSWEPDNEKSIGIPMFGVKRVNLKGYNPKYNSEWNPFVLQSNGSDILWLSRSLAKVTLELSDELKEGLADIMFVSADIGNKYGGNFHVIPDLDRMDGFSLTGGTGQIVSPPDYGRWSVTDAGADKVLNFNISKSGDKAYIYLPECVVDVLDPPEISVTLSVGGGHIPFKFKFKEYPVSGQLPSGAFYWNNIIRNHSYRFYIMLDNRVISVTPDNWGSAFDNTFNFG